MESAMKMNWRSDIIESTYRELKRPALCFITEQSSLGNLQLTVDKPVENGMIVLEKDEMITVVGTCMKKVNSSTMKIKIVITTAGEMGWLWPNETRKV
jgi:hypothetical protein